MKWLSGRDLKTEIIALIACFIFLYASSLLRLKIAVSPIPISLLTFAVGLLSLSLGGTRASVLVALFLAFRLAKAFFQTEGFRVTPELGYLIGMVISSFLIGKFSEAGFADGFLRTVGILYVGSAVVLFSGAFGLSFFVPANELFFKAVAPFLVGDLLKNLSASLLFVKLGEYFAA